MKNSYHPFLFAFLNILFLFTVNFGKVQLSEIILPLIIILIITGIGLFFFHWHFKNYNKAALFVSFSIILFFSFGFLFDGIVDLVKMVHGSFVFRNRYLLLSFAFIYALVWLILFRSKKNFVFISKALNFISSALILLNLTLCSIKSAEKNWHGVKYKEKKEFITNLVAGNSRPDIYYITVDEFAGLNTIKKYYGYDSRPLYDYFTKKKFYIATKSRSNYAKTDYSLATSINMAFYHKENGLLQQKEVEKQLTSIGYRCIDKMPFTNIADIICRFTSDPFLIQVINGSILRTITPDLHRLTILNILNHFDRIVKIPGPKFVHIHILCPHIPFVFGPNGERVSYKDFDNWEDKKYYLNQWIFMSKKLPSLIDTILALSTNKPIIVIQADHGPRGKFASHNHEAFEEVLKMKSDTASGTDTKKADYFKRAFSIFNAYYFPDQNYSTLYDSISPVNSFRTIFDKYFSAHYGKLKDESFYSMDDINFINITDQIADSSYFVNLF